MVKSQSSGQGIGRHSKEEIQELAKKDLKSLSDYLGKNKKYMMGNKFSEVDCTIFSFIIMVIFGLKEDNAIRVYMEKELPNLVEYFERIKADYWQDWDDCLYKEDIKKDSKKDDDDKESEKDENVKDEK